ncbi:hypothetical protein NB717_003185 [Xanthomonas sacchari]|nr:hypothetical protein [Xanthomonas sacchari]MCW0438560.1 hypothetical protein [Xanthomonas sacchari]MCW0462117.1 hypothetical protein [Xanthomonas sacchari]MCW0465837.1 hypothetical protein [Xanthomonas sacchari]
MLRIAWLASPGTSCQAARLLSRSSRPWSVPISMRSPSRQMLRTLLLGHAWVSLTRSSSLRITADNGRTRYSPPV